MVEGREGRALAAGRHVRVPELVHRIDAELPGDPLAHPELAGETDLRTVIDRLAVKPDELHAARIDPELAMKRRMAARWASVTAQLEFLERVGLRTARGRR